MNMSRLYELARNAILYAIAYKFEFRAQIHEALTGDSGGAHRAARDLSRLVADEYSGKAASESKKEELNHSLESARFQ